MKSHKPKATMLQRVAPILAVLLMAGTLLTPTIASAEVPLLEGEKLTLSVSAMIRLRLLYSGGRDLGPGSDQDWVAQRARFGIRADMFKLTSIFIQFQDVRKWGEETDTLGDFVAGGFDVHQAYLEVRPFDALTLRAGRMMIAHDAHRIIGTVEWTNQGRVFDAALAKLVLDPVEIQIWWAKVGEEDTAGFNVDKDVGALWAHLSKWKAFTPSLLAVVDRDVEVERLRFTFGVHLKGNIPFGDKEKGAGFSYVVEAYEQLGEMGALNIQAGLLAIKVGVTSPWKGIGLDLFADMLTGDGDNMDNKTTVFNTLFATNHKFYGFMDFFLNIPVNTAGRGLMDFGARLRAKPWKNGKIMIDFHQFRAAAGDAALPDWFGTELDITAGHKFGGHLNLQAGYSFFVPGAAMGGGDKLEHFAYIFAAAGF